MNMNFKQGDTITYMDGTKDTVTDVLSNGIIMVEKGFGESTSFTKEELARVINQVMQLPPPKEVITTPTTPVNATSDEKNLRKERLREELNAQRKAVECAIVSSTKPEVSKIVELGVSAIIDIVTKALNKL